MKCKLINDFPNYRIYENGLIESNYKFKTNIPCDVWRPIKQVYDKSCGYMIVTLCNKGVRKNKRVHRLLMEAFVENPLNKAHINHIDGNKLNNSLENLEWNTPKENAQHATNTGLNDHVYKAQSIPVCMYLNDKTTLIKCFPSLHHVTRETGVAWQNVWKVCTGKRHTAGGFHWKYKNV